MKKEKREKVASLQEIEKWLNTNNINSWQDYIEMDNIQVIELEELIYKQANSDTEVNQIKFDIKLILYNEKELTELLRSLEYKQDFELCIKVVEKLKEMLH